MPIVPCARLPNLGIISVEPYTSIFVRDGKGEDRSVKLLLALYRPEELDSARRNRYAVSILTICDVECRRAAFHLAGE